MRQLTHISGTEVLIQQPAYGPHPHPDFAGEMFAYTGILHVQLADGREGYIGESCLTEDCPKLWDNCKSAAAHLSVHNGKERSSTIPVDTLKSLLRIAKRFQNAGVRDYAQRTADEMNRLGISTNDGEPWNAIRVGRLFNKWQDKVKAPLPPSRPRQVTEPDLKVTDVVPAQRAAVQAAVERRQPVVAEVIESSIVSRLLAIGDKLHEMSNEFERLASDIGVELAKSKVVDHATLEKAAKWDALDPAVFEKAAKWDAAQQLFGNGK